MKPKTMADYRSLFWALVLLPAMPLLHFWAPELSLWLLPASLYLAYCAGVLTHNHNHTPVFSSRRANTAYSMWLSVLYGFPTFSWIPTHNRNHHRYANGEGDRARTEEHAPRPALLAALTYPFFCSRRQASLVAGYVLERLRGQRGGAASVLLQCGAVVGAHAGAALIAMAYHGTRRGLLVYLFGLGLPAAFAPWSMMFTNYLQHAGCDPSSRDNHSRNFVSGWVNWWVFDAGYHTVHHEQPGAHWSRLRVLHAARAARIHPSLNQHSIVLFCLQLALGRASLTSVAPAREA